LMHGRKYGSFRSRRLATPLS